MHRQQSNAEMKRRFELDFARVFAGKAEEQETELERFDLAELAEALDEHPGDEILTTAAPR